MRVHLFGAVSSGNVAAFGLRRAANDDENLGGREVADFVQNDFYVDNDITSRNSVDEVVKGCYSIV